MATAVSDLGKVLGKPLGGLGERSAEDEAYDAAMQRIELLLAEREQKQYNPTLLAIAQGMFAPSATGSFGEGLGAAAGNVLKTQEMEQKQAMENAQMRLQLAQAQKEQANLRAMQQDFGRTTGMGGQGVPGAGQPGQLRPLSEDDVLAFAARFPTKQGQEFAKIMADSIKSRRGKFAVSAQGQIVDLDTGQPIGGQQQTDYSTPFGTFPMTPNEYTKFQAAQAKGLGREWIDAYRSGSSTDIDKLVAPAAPGVPAAPAAEVDPNRPKPPMMMSKEERLTSEEEAKELAKSRAQATTKKIVAGEDAFLRKQTGQALQDLFSQEGMNQVTGVLEKPGLLPAMLKLAEEGVSLGRGYGISMPQVRDIFTANKINLPKNPGESKADYDARVQGVLDRVAQAGSLFSQIVFGLRSLAQGQGSISNFEQLIFNQMGPSFRDSVSTIMAKTKHMMARADFDQFVRDSLVESGLSFQKFSMTPAYAEAVKNYDSKIRNIYSGVMPGGAPAAAGKPAAPAGPSAPATKSAYDAELERRRKAQGVQ